MDVRALRNWCDNVGGEWKEEAIEGRGRNAERKETNRCVLNNEGREEWDPETEEFIIRDTEFVEIDDRGYLRAQTRDGSDQTLDLTYVEWEQHPENGQQNYKERDVVSYLIDDLEAINGGWGDTLDARYFGTHVGETEDGEPIGLERRLEIEATKSEHEVREQLTSQEDMKRHYQAMKVDEWLRDAKNAAERGDNLPSGYVPLSGRSPEEWIQQFGSDEFQDELRELREMQEENQGPEHDPFPCPDDGEVGEAEMDGIEVEGEIDRIDCSSRETLVGLEGDDGSFYVFRGSPDGSRPKQVEIDGQKSRFDDFHLETHGTTKRNFT